MPTHQTVRLSAGRHRGPDHGTCVAELASMLAGERFSDHPRCACPALTAFLRGYNDAIDKRQRQDLYLLASELVGTRSPSERVTTARGDRLVALAWSYERRVGPVRISPNVGFAIRFDRYQGAGLHLGRVARRRPACHTEVLRTLRELIDAPVAGGDEPSDEHRRRYAPSPPDPAPGSRATEAALGSQSCTWLPSGSSSSANLPLG